MKVVKIEPLSSNLTAIQYTGDLGDIVKFVNKDGSVSVSDSEDPEEVKIYSRLVNRMEYVVKLRLNDWLVKNSVDGFHDSFYPVKNSEFRYRYKKADG